ncbi:hypothetical protein AVP_122 [Aerococcus phage vB_AviM_AVP]|nr:hypothetical protein AVP_122 [Aerococcus phage vB_AviM_AVP]
MRDISIEVLGYKESFKDSSFLPKLNRKFIEELYEEMEDKDVDEEVLFFVKGEILEDGVELPDPDAKYDFMLSIDDEPVCGGLAYDLDDVNEIIDDFVGIVSDIILGEYELVDSRDHDLDDLSLEDLKELNDSLDIDYLPESEGFNLTMDEYNDLGPLSRKIYDYLANDLLEEHDDTYLETLEKDKKAKDNLRNRPNKNRDRVEKLNYIVDVYNELGSLIEDYIAEENLNE